MKNLKLTVLLAAFLATITSAHAHAPVALLGKSFVFPHHSTLALQSSNFSNMQLTGSGRTLANIYKYNTEAGIIIGAKAAYSQGILQGGQIRNSFYQGSNGNYTLFTSSEVDTFGNNPNNTINSPNTLVGSPTTFFTFGKNGKGLGVPSSNIVALGGTSKFLSNPINLVNLNAINTGFNLAAHPIGGQLFGTLYTSGPVNGPYSTVLNNNFFLAFGNNPFAVASPSTATNVIANSYIQLTKHLSFQISSGQLFTTYYTRNPFSTDGTQFNPYYLGNNPFNLTNGSPIFLNARSFANYFTFK